MTLGYVLGARPGFTKMTNFTTKYSFTYQGQISYKNIDPLSIYLDFSKKYQFSDFMHPSPTSVPNDTIFCQNVPNKSPNTVTERYLENFFLRAKI